ncbi:MAG TPA: cytochrome c [Marinospirillum sp.]|uniref:cytochrome c n=1 Tax=Marinospirillum sp. TaxID=2183934 RepID=UPI002B46194C|nr:cytochrome c [Marinospirillum sp.]HKM16160.1 cytochrome c [Marinospirillum sp.]
MRSILYPLAIALFFVGFLAIPLANAQEISAKDIDLRIETFDEIDKLFKALRFKVVNQRSTNHEAALKFSSQLVELVYRLPDLFDVPSAADAFPQSRSRPEIWSRKTFFDAQMFEFVDNLEDINDEIKAGNLTKAGQLIDETAKGCRRCHNAFRYK